MPQLAHIREWEPFRKRRDDSMQWRLFYVFPLLSLTPLLLHNMTCQWTVVKSGYRVWGYWEVWIRRLWHLLRPRLLTHQICTRVTSVSAGEHGGEVERGKGQHWCWHRLTSRQGCSTSWFCCPRTAGLEAERKETEEPVCPFSLSSPVTLLVWRKLRLVFISPSAPLSEL